MKKPKKIKLLGGNELLVTLRNSFTIKSYDAVDDRLTVTIAEQSKSGELTGSKKDALINFYTAINLGSLSAEAIELWAGVKNYKTGLPKTLKQ